MNEFKDVVLAINDAEGRRKLQMNSTLFLNLIICTYCFALEDGSYPDRGSTLRKTKAIRKKKHPTYPFNEKNLEGFFEWWKSEHNGVKFSKFLEDHPGDIDLGQHSDEERLAETQPGKPPATPHILGQPNTLMRTVLPVSCGHDEFAQHQVKWAKIEYGALQNINSLAITRNSNIEIWRRHVRENRDGVERFEVEEDRLHALVTDQKRVMLHARRRRVLAASPNRWWVFGVSCISHTNQFWLFCNKVRANAGWQWLTLIVNLVNVIGLMSDDTSCDGDCDDIYQDTVLPVLGLIASIVFTLDMVDAMVVIGLKTFFHNPYDQLDFFVVLTGWLDIATEQVDFSSLRALRVLRVLKMVKYFSGIGSVIGSIYHNLGPIWNVIRFMLFWMTIFGILGITLFSGRLRHRCVIDTAYPSQTSGITYSSAYADVNATASMGEYEYFCTDSANRESFPFPYRCASYMTCNKDYGNPNYGATRVCESVGMPAEHTCGRCNIFRQHWGGVLALISSADIVDLV